MSFSFENVDATDLEKEYGFSSLTSRLIQCSGITREQIQELRTVPTLTTSKAQCVMECVQRIVQAREKHEKVFVGGDYDADGICSTSIMKYTLDALGIQNGYYIPDRLKEGYGLQSSIVSLAHEKGYSLIITVDNGVKCNTQIDLAHSLGMEVIVTDHHVLEEEVHADIVVHPDFMEERYSTLSGAGVALQISRNLLGNVEKLTALACVAAIGDVMPLWKETRAIVSEGLHLLQQGKPASLCALFQNASVIDTESVAFQVVPKLNAIARMEDSSNVNTLVRFLLQENPYAILKYAAQINAVNEARKSLSRSMVTKATSLLRDEDFLVVYDESFKQGLAGIVAGRLVHTYHKPAVVFAGNGEELVGSARSVEGLNIYDFFSDFEELLHFGGHAMAAGLTISKDSYASFCSRVQQKMKDMHADFSVSSERSVVVSAEDYTLEALMELDGMQPLPKELKDLSITVLNPKCTSVQKWTRVTKYHFYNSSGGFDGIVFGNGKTEERDTIQRVTGKPSINRFRNLVTAQMRIEEME